MNNNPNTLSRINDVIGKNTSGAIILPANPSIDAVTSASSLYLGLSKMGKNVNIASDTSINQPDIIASDKIQNNIVTSGDNLVISFPYGEGSIDKVDYNIQNNTFNLIIAPRPGFPKIDPKQVKYSYTGGNLDFLIVIDAPTLNSLGGLYLDNQQLFQGKEIINIDRHLTNSMFGTINFVNKTTSSISESMLKLLQGLQVNIDRDMATNLYMGIIAATNNLTSYSVTADTFETIAQLLRLGAIKKQVRKPAMAQGINNGFGKPTPMSFAPKQTPPKPFNYQPAKQANNFENQNAKPIENVEKEIGADENTPPQDWLKPKIFRSGDLI